MRQETEHKGARLLNELIDNGQTVGDFFAEIKQQHKEGRMSDAEFEQWSDLLAQEEDERLDRKLRELDESDAALSPELRQKQDARMEMVKQRFRDLLKEPRTIIPL